MQNSRKLSHPVFRGAFNPNKAEEWVKAIEKIFSVLACTEYQKVAFATYMLEVNAEFWWTRARRLLEGSQIDITWEMFKKAFYHKNFPTSVRIGVYATPAGR